VATPGNGFEPTGALIKAVLVNTSVDMTGVAGYPSNAEGWGRLVLDETLHFAGDPGRMWAVDVRRAQGLTTSGQREFAMVQGPLPLPCEGGPGRLPQPYLPKALPLATSRHRLCHFVPDIPIYIYIYIYIRTKQSAWVASIEYL
jgi:hypothetical protein